MRFLNLPLINYEEELDLQWSKSCVTSYILNNTEVAANPNSNPPVEPLPERFTTGATFQINNAEHYVSV